MQISIEQYLVKFQIEKQKTLSERSELLKELYSHYLYWNKKDNIKKFLQVHKDNRKIYNKELQEQFKKSKDYYKPITVKLFCVRLSHIPTQDLYYLTSIAKDMRNRGNNFNKWLWWSIKNI